MLDASTAHNLRWPWALSKHNIGRNFNHIHWCLPYWQADTLNIPCGAHGGPAGQKQTLSGLFSTEANTFSLGVKRYPGTPSLVSTSFSNVNGNKRHRSLSYTCSVVFLVMCGGKMEPSVPFKWLQAGVVQCGKYSLPLYLSMMPNLVMSSTPEKMVTRSYKTKQNQMWFFLLEKLDNMCHARSRRMRYGIQAVQRQLNANWFGWMDSVAIRNGRGTNWARSINNAKELPKKVQIFCYLPVKCCSFRTWRRILRTVISAL